MLPRQTGSHRPHVIPRPAGGGDEDENIEYLTREEHAAAHRDLYEKHGRDQDRRAYLLLENYGDLNSPELKQWRKENNSNAALAAHKVKLDNGFYDKLGKLNSERLKGTTNEEHSKKLKETFKANPMYWWNNGVKNTRNNICPGPEWIRGKLAKGK